MGGKYSVPTRGNETVIVDWRLPLPAGGDGINSLILNSLNTNDSYEKDSQSSAKSVASLCAKEEFNLSGDFNSIDC